MLGRQVQYSAVVNGWWSMLTASVLRNALSYNPKTGVFIWKEGGRGRGRKKGARAGSIKTSKGRQNRQITVNGHTHTAGYMAWLYVTGQPPPGILERLDNDPLNDAFDNLTPSDYSTIKKSRHGSRRNTTGISGVSWRQAEGGHYAVSIGDPGRGTGQYLGRTRDFFEACCMRKSAELRLGYNTQHQPREYDLPEVNYRKSHVRQIH